MRAALVTTLPLLAACVFDASGLRPTPSDRPRIGLTDMQALDAVDADGQLPIDGRPRDAMAPEVMPPDTRAPDVDSPYYVNEDFATGYGAVSPKTGTWTWDSAQQAIRQSSVAGNGYYAEVSVPASDYVAETSVTISSIQNVAGLVESAALSVRVQPPVGANAPGQIACRVSPDASSFGIIRCSGLSTLCSLISDRAIPFAYGTAYRIRATVIGASYTCELPDLAKTVTATDSSFPTGGVALSTFHADAQFAYLKVWKP